jgi:hypothetical protein
MNKSGATTAPSIKTAPRWRFFYALMTSCAALQRKIDSSCWDASYKVAGIQRINLTVFFAV